MFIIILKNHLNCNAKTFEHDFEFYFLYLCHLNSIDLTKLVLFINLLSQI